MSNFVSKLSPINNFSNGDFQGIILYSSDNILKKYKTSSLPVNQFNSQQKFPIASISKIITSVLTILILDEYNIYINSAASEYLPTLPDYITFEHLLTHTSGLNNYTDFNVDDIEREKILDEDEFFKMITPQNINSLTTQFNYNNANYIILEKLLEDITGESFKELLKKYIFEPCQMKNSGLITNTQNLDVMGYNTDNTPAVAIDYSWLGAGAGIYSPAEDLYKFISTLLNGKILNKSQLQNLFDDRGNNYGLGCSIGMLDKNKIIYHEGGIDGFSTMLIIDPKTRNILILFSNQRNPNIEQIAKERFSQLFSSKQLSK